MADNRKLAQGLRNLPASAREDLAGYSDGFSKSQIANALRNAGEQGIGIAKSVARGVPQMATGFVDLAAMPFEAAGMIEPGKAVGSTKWLESQGYLPPPQEGFVNQTTELLASGLDPSTWASHALPLVAGIGKTVWHGSPHTFEKFDLSKIGTGEGAQAYGHGLYFADAPSTAMTYQPRDPRFEQNIMQKYSQAEKVGNYPAMQVYEDFLLHKNPDEIRSALPEFGLEGKDLEQAQNALDYAAKQYQSQTAGSLYKVDLPDEQIAKMLDWDKPLSEQPEILGKLRSYAEQNPNMNSMFRESLSPMEAGSTTGDAIYRTLNRSLDESKALMQQRDALISKYQTGKMSMSDSVRAMNPEDRTAFSEIAQRIDDQKNVAARSSGLLNELGIPGIQYLDQASRGAGDGTRNYVVFSDEIPQILERNGTLVNK